MARVVGKITASGSYNIASCYQSLLSCLMHAAVILIEFELTATGRNSLSVRFEVEGTQDQVDSFATLFNA